MNNMKQRKVATTRDVVLTRNRLTKLERGLWDTERQTVETWAPYRLTEFVQGQFKYWGGRSVISGSSRRICLRRFWPDRPLSECNVVILTSAEALRLRQLLSDGGDWQALYPANVRALMQEMRLTDEECDRAHEDGRRRLLSHAIKRKHSSLSVADESSSEPAMKRARIEPK